MSVVEVWSMINGSRINHTHGSGDTWTATGTAQHSNDRTEFSSNSNNHRS